MHANRYTDYICTGAFADGNHWEQDLRWSKHDNILMVMEIPGFDFTKVTALV